MLRTLLGAHANPHAECLQAELTWLQAVMEMRFAAYGDREAVQPHPLAPPAGLPLQGPYAALLHELALSAAERLVLILALAPHLAPHRLDAFLLQNTATARRFTEFGGLLGQSHAGFLPTVDTALFLLAGDDIAARLAHQALFTPGQPLLREGLLQLDHRHPEEPPNSAALRLGNAALQRLLEGNLGPATPSFDFPATLITTPLDWDDLILDEDTRSRVEMVGIWLESGQTLMRDWGLARRLKPGYRALFYGEPGTGKTLSACLLGKRYGRPVYRVDLSRVVSKWIGETEKNLAALFDQAADRDWILFFDEADALFGKRSDESSANDRSANQQIAYLLQRLEAHPGVAILATNQQGRLDEAFARRFQIAVRFAMPDAPCRLRLWRESFAEAGFRLAPDVDLHDIAQRHELAGGAIINVLRHAAMVAVSKHPPVVHAHDLLDGIREEFRKDGRFMPA